jgi:beta-lactamase class A
MTLHRFTASTALVGAALAATVAGPAAARPAPARLIPMTVEPVLAPAAAFPLEQENANLDRRLEGALRAQGWGDLLASGSLAVSLVDLSSEQLRYAGINDDTMVYAASLPKIAILLGAFDALERGALTWSPALREELVDMIRVSSNTAATAVLHRVGFAQVAQAVQQQPYRLYEPEDGGLWVGKAYGENDYWRRDPVGNTSHGATARQAARFFVLLEKGMLVSRDASARMKDILGDPGIRHKFVRGLGDREGLEIYRKSGTWRDYHADAALIEDGDRTYVAVGLACHPDGARILERLIVTLDGLVGQPRVAPH